MKYSCKLTTLNVTEQLAVAIAKVIRPNLVLSLNGTLRAGKTTLVREILHALNIVGNIKSPTFTLVEPYTVANCNIYHFDLYRFSEPEEWFDLGFDEYFSGEFIAFIEWAEKAAGLIPQLDWRIDIEFNEFNERLLTIRSLTVMGEECLTALIKNVEN